MTQIRNFDEANKALAAYIPPAGSMREKYTLERMRGLMAALGNPQNSLKVIHVAGTSGKTSTGYYVAALLRAAGKKAGLTVSPYIEQVNERLQIDLLPLPEAEFCAALQEFLPLVEKAGLNPTYFEVLIALAYWYFAKTRVDYAVVEVGLGGLLDGTNVVARPDKLCVITDIGYDHTEILGDTLELIAAQKAGIITSGNQVVMYRQPAEITDAIMAAAEKQKAQLIFVTEDDALKFPVTLPAFQCRNWSLAYAAYRLLQKRDNLSRLDEKDLVETMGTLIPARMERFKIGDKTVILDGAHNPQKLHAFLSAAKEAAAAKPMAALVSFMEAPEVKIMQNTAAAAMFCDSMIITQFTSAQDMPKKSQPAEDILKICQSNGYKAATVIKDQEGALNKLLESPEDILLITGSLYLVGQLRPIILQLAHG